MAIMALVATIALPTDSVWSKDELAQDYSAISGDDKQGTNFGWVPNDRAEAGTKPIGADPYNTERFGDADETKSAEYAESVKGRRARRERLRRSYRRRFLGIRSDGNPYAGPSETEEDSEMVEGVDDCDCGEDCICPPLVCKDKGCKTNYVFVVSAPEWCAPCREMHPVIKELRDDGFKVYYFDVDKFPDLDAKFDVSGYPTFIVYDKGKEQARATGIVPKKWFTDRLVKIDDQKPEPKPEPENPYDNLVE